MKRWVVFALFSVIAGLAIYANQIEPNWLSVTRIAVQAPVGSSLKIAHLSDLHFGNFGRIEESLIRAINEEKPDLIVVTGDTLDSPKSLNTAKQFFGAIHPPLGIWAVLGNWENWIGANTKEAFSNFGVRLLINESVQVTNELVLSGFDDSYSGKPDRTIASATSREKKQFCVALLHSPEFWTEYGSQCPLSLAGHTHGGQINIPLYGPLWLPRHSGSYVSGWYSSGGRKLYVSRGIGTSILPIRFLSRPELIFITLSRASS